jgi:DNA-binding GntR family transcriptional regulator
MTIPIRPKLAEDIADYLAERIIQMKIQPGERITEAQVREVFDVSGSPVREALMILEKKHLVELIPRRGARATEISPEFISNLYDVMAELVGLLMRRVIEDLTQEELNRLLEVVEKGLDCARNKDVLGYFEAIRAISLLGLEASRNPLLTGMIRECIPSFHRVNIIYLLHSSYNLEDSIKFVHEISKHIVDKNAEMVEKTLKAHLGRERERVLEIVSKYLPEQEKAAG